MPQVVDKKVPEVSIVKTLKRRINWNSPDYMERRVEDHIPLLVMDNTRIGGANFSLVEQHPYLGEGITVSERFQMKESNLYDDVMFHKIPDEDYVKGMVCSSIVGDVMVVDPITLLELDRFYQNTYMFSRIQTWVWLLDQQAPFKNKSRASLKVWCYVMNDEFWQDKKPKIDAPKTKTNKGRYVYDFDAAADVEMRRSYDSYWNPNLQNGWVM